MSQNLLPSRGVMASASASATGGGEFESHRRYPPVNGYRLGSHNGTKFGEEETYLFPFSGANISSSSAFAASRRCGGWVGGNLHFSLTRTPDCTEVLEYLVFCSFVCRERTPRHVRSKIPKKTASRHGFGVHSSTCLLFTLLVSRLK